MSDTLNNLVFTPIPVESFVKQIVNELESRIIDKIKPEEIKTSVENYTPAEVERKFRISGATRWRWTNIGILKGYRIGNRLYYRKDEVDDLLNKKRR